MYVDMKRFEVISRASPSHRRTVSILYFYGSISIYSSLLAVCVNPLRHFASPCLACPCPPCLCLSGRKLQAAVSVRHR